jgi:hypothetical protein
MADFRFRGTLNGEDAVGVVKDVVAGTAASIAIGDLVIPDDVNPGYVRLIANAEVIAAAYRVYIALSASDETAGVDGTVKLQYAPNMILEGTATTPANLVQAVIDTLVTVDVNTGVITVDENDTANGFLRIKRPQGGAGNFETTSGVMEVIANPTN